MINLEFVRHGKTNLNGKHYISTNIDSPLYGGTIKKCIKMRYEEGTFDNIYSSPSLRTIQTAHFLYPYKDVIITPLIKQRDMGILTNCFKYDYDKEYLEMIRNYLITPEGAETKDEVLYRINLFLESVKCDNEVDSNVLVVTHNGIMRIIKKEILNVPYYEDTNNLEGFSLKLKK